ncbi:hypothetical protein [Duganella aceris]|uniref:DUF1640 domain-containing protein n=1 Tax=Duganella aceris TaxID=2703883 RepID=A0ABX0FH39_9BURK|nr:hypothetical protein [Duganella aceris]NGZ83812.1 hypothetical protein [Duganella aceris]
MNTPADRDYMNAKAEAIAATLSLDAKAYQEQTNSRLDAMNSRLDSTNSRLDETNNRLDATNNRLDATNNRLDTMEQAMQSGFNSIREEVATKIANSQAELVKWMVATVLAGVAISTSITAVLINNATPKASPPTPIVIYAQPPSK